ncbi:MAG: hypothetical protein GY936_03260 [Ignavibacteriae bacterium]|nr:hypothetical protein [Ignavibacteriota bacterium]
MNYKEEQVGWFLNLLLLVLILFIEVLYILQIGDKPIPALPALIFQLLMFTVILLFYKLKIKVDDKHIKIIFGIGLLKKKILLDNISNITQVRNKWYHGWGVRMIKNGWLYNLHGLSALEIKFKSKKSIVRIGIKSNSLLENEIEKRIN